MTNEKFTPGPWKVTDDGFVTAGDKYVHEPNALGMEIPQAEIIPEEVMANCHLIAAAPELYTAMRDMVAWFEDTDRIIGDLYNNNIKERVHAALAKARGE